MTNRTLNPGALFDQTHATVKLKPSCPHVFDEGRLGTRASEGSTRATWSYVACLGSYRVQRVGVEHHLVRRTIAAVSQGGGKISSPRRER